MGLNTFPDNSSGSRRGAARFGPGRFRAAQVLPFEILTSRQGLPQSQVATVAQDAEGYIWVGTMEGLGRYNGTSFTTFSASDGIGNGRIWELLLARNGTMYAATGGGVAFWRNHQWNILPIKALGSARCRAIAEDAAGNIWIGSDNGIFFGREKNFQKAEQADPKAQELVYDLLPDQGTMLAVSSTGLWRVDTRGTHGCSRSAHRPGQLPVHRRRSGGIVAGQLCPRFVAPGLDGWKRVPPERWPRNRSGGWNWVPRAPFTSPPTEGDCSCGDREAAPSRTGIRPTACPETLSTALSKTGKETSGSARTSAASPGSAGRR